MTETPAQQHPWAKYYTERGLSRPAVAELVIRPGSVKLKTAGSRAKITTKSPEISAELAQIVATVTAQAAIPGSTAAPFITAMQKQAVAREVKRRARVRMARFALAAAVVAVLLHVTVTRFVYREPATEAVQAHIQGLAETVLPYFSTARQPMQADGVTITQADQIDAKNFRYVASVTLRLRKPLYVPAVTNGTAQYRRLQQVLETSRNQEIRFSLFSSGDAPEAPSLPLLLQQSHRAGESIVVRVPFTARRYGWQWRIEAPQIALQTANRSFEGDALDRYDEVPHLIFGAPATLAEIRRRVKQANDYVVAVAKQVQRHADVEAVADARPVEPSLADRPAQSVESLADRPAQEAAGDAVASLADVAARPAIDPDAPAVILPLSPKVVLLGHPGGSR